MLEKKELTEEELENVSGGSCDDGDGDGNGTTNSIPAGDGTICTSCSSNNVVITSTTYNFTYYKCNSCGAEFKIETQSV